MKQFFIYNGIFHQKIFVNTFCSLKTNLFLDFWNIVGIKFISTTKFNKYADK